MAYDFQKWVANDMATVQRRRWLPLFLGTMMVVMALLGVLETFDQGTEDERFPSLTIVLLSSAVVTLSSPFARDVWLGPRVAKPFDEFERDALARATTRAYLVVMSLLIAIFGWLWIASVYHWPLPRTPLDWSTLGFSLLAIGAALPIFFAEIAVPLPPADETFEV